MSTAPASTSAPQNHAALMDTMYASQRHIYDLTRKYYLFGRDRMIRELDLPHGGSVLEVGCGTGRNLAVVRKHWPKAELFGLDISAQMLKSARATLGTSAALAEGDATDFDPVALFGQAQFDRVIMPYTTSMIPVWREAITQACALIAPGGSLHVVDFGDMARLPAPLRGLLRGWLARFHVSPRHDLPQSAIAGGAVYGLTGSASTGMGGYYQRVTLRRAA